MCAAFFFSHNPGFYFTGDGISRDADGHLQITGRVDDVIKIKGRRIGTAELERALVRLLCLPILMHTCNTITAIKLSNIHFIFVTVQLFFPRP